MPSKALIKVCLIGAGVKLYRTVADLNQQNSFMWDKSGRNSSLSKKTQVTTFYNIDRQHLYVINCCSL